MSQPLPSYGFITSDGQRRFVHSWHLKNNEVIECNKCGLTTCKDTDAYGVHWPRPKTMTSRTATNKGDIAAMSIGIESSSWSTCVTNSPGLKELKQVIVNKNVETFMLCDTKSVSDTRKFLLDAGIKAIPDLLNVMYSLAQQQDVTGQMYLDVKVLFYVQVKTHLFVLQSTELAIKHHYDIRESVDMIFAMLLEKLRTFMASKYEYYKETEHQQYSIKSILLRIRKCHHKQSDYMPTLPMQYMRRQQHQDQEGHAKHSNSHNFDETKTPNNNDLMNLSSCFEKHLDASSSFQPPFPCNLFSFQLCENSLELFVVPYYISNSIDAVLVHRNFIILCNAEGYFLELREIFNIKRFLHHSMEDHVIACPRCGMNFNEPNKLQMHKMLNCGNDFEMHEVSTDSIEIFENCLLIEKSVEYTLYGLIE